jgi:hypothetical protein
MLQPELVGGNHLSVGSRSITIQLFNRAQLKADTPGIQVRRLSAIAYLPGVWLILLKKHVGYTSFNLIITYWLRMGWRLPAAATAVLSFVWPTVRVGIHVAVSLF